MFLTINILCSSLFYLGTNNFDLWGTKMEVMSKEKPALDIPTFFHSILFSYQKKLKEILGSGEAVFVHPVLDTFNTIERERELHLIDGESVDEVLNNFQDQLMKTGLVKKVKFEKIGPEKFLFSVDGCAFSDPCHKLLDPKDVTCTYALIAMALFQSVTGKKVKPAMSEFSSEGAKTIIESL